MRQQLGIPMLSSGDWLELDYYLVKVISFSKIVAISEIAMILIIYKGLDLKNTHSDMM
jgi:hypothetical protein